MSKESLFKEVFLNYPTPKEVKNLEFETRFHPLYKYQPITYSTFQRVLSHFSSSSSNQTNEERETIDENFTVTTAMNTYTYRKTTVISSNGEEVSYMKKTSLNRGFNKDFALRISMATENPLTFDEFERGVRNATNRNIRRKKRYSIPLPSSTLDLTEVEGEDGKVEYEIELEMKETSWTRMKKSLRVYAITALQVWKAMHQTPVLYTVGEMQNIVKYINLSIKGETSKYHTVHRVYSNARNLKKEDMTEEGLLGIRGEEEEGEEYFVTDKADGERALLCTTPYGVVLSRGKIISLIYSPKKEENDFNGYCIDVEYVSSTALSSNKGKEEKESLLLAFDLVSRGRGMGEEVGDMSIQEELFEKRLDTLTDFFNLIWKRKLKGELKKAGYELALKEYISVGHSGVDFYKAMLDMNSHIKTRPYKTDGFMFTPNTTYIVRDQEGNRVDSLPQEERYLSQNPDICKLKPKEELTIDFICKEGILYSYSREEKGLIEFKGTEEISYIALEENPPLLTGEGNNQIPSDTVVEFAWHGEETGFQPVRTRPDKPVPNDISIARSVWEDIHNPIEESTWKGEDTVLMEQYHMKTLNKYISGAKEGKKVYMEGFSYNIQDKGKFDYIFMYNAVPSPSLLRKTHSKTIIVLLYQNTELTKLLLPTVSNDAQKATLFSSSPSTLSSSPLREERDKEEREDIVLDIQNSFETPELPFDTAIFSPMNEEIFLNPYETVLSASYVLHVFKNKPKNKNIRDAVKEEILMPHVEEAIEFIKPNPLEDEGREEGADQGRDFMTYVKRETSDEEEDSNQEEADDEYEFSQEDADKGEGERERFRGMLRNDEVDDLLVPWHNENVVRIGTIGDGHCLLHTLIKATLPFYSTLKRDKQIRLVSQIRNKFSDYIYEMVNDEDVLEFNEWILKSKNELIETIVERFEVKKSTLRQLNKNQLISSYLMLEKTIFYKYLGEIYEVYKGMGEEDREETFPLYTPTIEGMRKLLRSSDFLGDEVYSMIGNKFGIDILILRATEDDLKFHTEFFSPEEERKVVVVNGTGSHYELIGVVREDENGEVKAQTLFDRHDPFIQRAMEVNRRE